MFMNNKTGGHAIYLDGYNNYLIPPPSGLQLPMILGRHTSRTLVQCPSSDYFLLDENGEEYDTISKHISNLYTHEQPTLIPFHF